MFERYIHWVSVRPWAVLIPTLLLISILCAGTARLHFRSDERVFFASETPELRQLDAFQSRYGPSQNVLVFLRAKDGDLLTPEHLAAVAAISADVLKAPYAKRVDSPTRFVAATGDAETLTLDHLWRPGDATDAAGLQQLRKKAEDSPLLMGRLLSRDFRSGLVAVALQIPPDRLDKAAGEVMADMRSRAERYRQSYPTLEVHLSGSVALDDAFDEASSRDGALLMPIMIGLVLVLLLALVRDLYAVFSASLLIAASVGGALGLGAWLGIPLSSVAVAAPYVIIIVTMCDTVHFLFAVVRKGQETDDPKVAVQHALRESAWPIFLTCATTAVGFFSLVTSAAPPFIHLGLFCGFGTVLAWLFSVSLLPALLSLRRIRGGNGLLKFRPYFEALGRAVTARPWRAMLLVVVPALFFSAFITRNQLDERYIRYFDSSFEFRVGTDAMNQYLGGFYTLEYDLPSGEPQGVSQPAYLHSVDRFAAWLRAQPGVTHVESFADHMKMMNRALEGGAAAEYRIPDSPGALAQLLGLYELQLPAGYDIGEKISADHGRSRLTVSLQDLSTARIAALADQADAWLATHEPQLSKASATGTALMFARIAMSNIRQTIQGDAVTFVAIGLFLLLAFRSFLLAGVAMFANIVPSIATIGAWGLLVGEIGMAGATIISITLGIVVDDTIHILTTIQRKVATGKRVEEILPDLYGELGPTITANTLCLTAGFFVLAQSGFQINAWIGQMTCMVMLVALVFDLLFIPAVLVLLQRRRLIQPSIQVKELA